MRAKWAAFSFIPFFPKQFSEQAFVSPRCFCLCSDLILPINSPHNPAPVYYVPYLSGAGAQQICHDRSYLHLGKHNRAQALASSSRMKGPEKEKE